MIINSVSTRILFRGNFDQMRVACKSYNERGWEKIIYWTSFLGSYHKLPPMHHRFMASIFISSPYKLTQNAYVNLMIAGLAYLNHWKLICFHLPRSFLLLGSNTHFRHYHVLKIPLIMLWMVCSRERNIALDLLKF